MQCRFVGTIEHATRYPIYQLNAVNQSSSRLISFSETALPIHVMAPAGRLHMLTGAAALFRSHYFTGFSAAHVSGCQLQLQAGSVYFGCTTLRQWDCFSRVQVPFASKRSRVKWAVLSPSSRGQVELYVVRSNPSATNLAVHKLHSNVTSFQLEFRHSLSAIPPNLLLDAVAESL